jgi:hypothetical protein
MVKVAQPSSARRVAVPPAPEAEFAWVKVWAVIGAVYGGVFVYVMSRWLLSGPKPTPPGPDAFPTGMQIAIYIQVVGGLISVPVIFYLFLIRPWRREGRMTFDGKMLIACATLFWLDTYVNALAPFTLYNAHIPNLGSWNNFIPYLLTPSFSYPHGERIVEPIIWTGPCYVYAVFGFSVLLSFFMRKMKERWPALTRVQLIGLAFVMAAVGDLISESIWLRSGIYIFNGVPTPSWLTLFDGKYYQFPLVEPIVMGAIWCAFACLRYFKNDKGQTVAERGVEKLKVSPQMKTGISLLATIGVFNLAAIVLGVLPMISWSVHQRPWPADVINRSYFLNNLCGPGTEYACPGSDVPIPHLNSPHVGPDGKLHGVVKSQVRQ